MFKVVYEIGFWKGDEMPQRNRNIVSRIVSREKKGRVMKQMTSIYKA